MNGTRVVPSGKTVPSGHSVIEVPDVPYLKNHLLAVEADVERRALELLSLLGPGPDHAPPTISSDEKMGKYRVSHISCHIR